MSDKKIVDYEILDKCQWEFKKFKIIDSNLLKKPNYYQPIRYKPISIKIFYKGKDKKPDINHYKKVITDDIYKEIHQGNPINLNYCYVKGFSSSEYKKKYEEVCGIKSLAVVGAFFCDENKIDFSSVIFLGDKIENHNPKFTSNDVSVDFSDSIFISKEVSFKSSKFMNEGVNFSRTKFISDILSFWSTGFLNNYTFFFQIEHSGDKIHFQQSVWDCSLNFNNNWLYSDQINFYSTRFNGKITQFDINYYKGKVNFSCADFSKTELFFSDGYFKKSLDLSHVQISNDLDIKFQNCNGLILSDMYIKNYFYVKNIDKKLNLEDTKILGQLYIDWDKENVKDLIEEYYNDKLKKLDKLKNIYKKLDIKMLDEKLKPIIDFFTNSKKEHLDNNFLKKIKKYNKNNFISEVKGFMKNNYYEEKADQFRLLKENYRKLGKYKWEDKAYYEFRKNQFLAEKENLKKEYHDKNAKKDKFKYFLKKILLWVRKKIHKDVWGFGTKPVWILKSMFGWILFFHNIYLYSYLFGFDILNLYKYESLYKRIFNPFFYSLSSFTEIIFFNMQNLSFVAKVLTLSEGVLGAIMFIFLTITLSRKVR